MVIHLVQALMIFAIWAKFFDCSTLTALHSLDPGWDTSPLTGTNQHSSNAASFAHARRPFYTVEDMERAVWLLPDSHWLGQSPKGETTCNFSSAFWDRQTTHPTPTHR